MLCNKNKDYYDKDRRDIYFIHATYASDMSEKSVYQERIFRDRMVLVKDGTDILNSSDNVYNIEALDIDISEKYNGEFSPGQYVYYNGYGRIENAENSLSAIISSEINKALIKHITDNNSNNNDLKYKADQSDIVYDEVSDVHSFHINVGHGNCSIIVFKNHRNYEMWMVDCSVWDFMNSTMHINQLQSCLNYIHDVYRVNKISKLLITHLHYDHINAIPYLIKNGYIDYKTEVWMNIQYPWRQPSYLNILSQLNAIGVKFVDPVVRNSTSTIRILYPSKSYQSGYPAPNNHINNASVLYQIKLNGKSMLFTGDIETEGWNKVKCAPYLWGSDYYCISHHGSITGHIRNRCIYKNVNSLKFCASNTKVQILMGRDGAYSGIFSSGVLKSFKNICKTDEASSYIELNWKSGNVNFI